MPQAASEYIAAKLLYTWATVNKRLELPVGSPWVSRKFCSLRECMHYVTHEIQFRAMSA
jgi:hypothetical protein